MAALADPDRAAGSAREERGGSGIAEDKKRVGPDSHLGSAGDDDPAARVAEHQGALPCQLACALHRFDRLQSSRARSPRKNSTVGPKLTSPQAATLARDAGNVAFFAQSWEDAVGNYSEGIALLGGAQRAKGKARDITAEDGEEEIQSLAVKEQESKIDLLLSILYSNLAASQLKLVSQFTFIREY